MPGKVKVKILAGRNLPVMDRSSDTTDAYVEVKLGNTTYKTDVCRKSLNPQWNTEWYRFEVDDSELQDEPLQIRLMDHDTYSANDAIGKVYVDLNPLLLPVAPAVNLSRSTDGPASSTSLSGGNVMSGWIPVFDTMHGIRGEVNVIVKVELFSDFNKFRQSSCGVQFFCSGSIPHGYHAQVIHGFVEELVCNDDPEYQWIDKIRTPRASNEARQTLFLKLSGEVQRKIGLKALDLGGNAVIGYQQCFDLEGESGIVVRGIGTAVTLLKLQEAMSPPINALTAEELCVIPPSRNPSLSLSPDEVKNWAGLSPTRMGSRFPGLGKSRPKKKKKRSLMVVPPYLAAGTRHNSQPAGSLALAGYKNRSTQSLSTAASSEEAQALHDYIESEDARVTPRPGRFSRGLRAIGLSKKITALRARFHSDASEDGTESPDSSSSETSRLSLGNNAVKSKKSRFRFARKHKRSNSDSMAATLVLSLMKSSNLSRVVEVRESPGSSPTSPPRGAERGEDDEEVFPTLALGVTTSSEAYLRSGPRKEEEPDLKYVDGHLVSNTSSGVSSTSESSSSEEDDEPSEEFGPRPPGSPLPSSRRRATPSEEDSSPLAVSTPDLDKSARVFSFENVVNAKNGSKVKILETRSDVIRTGEDAPRDKYVSEVDRLLQAKLMESGIAFTKKTHVISETTIVSDTGTPTFVEPFIILSGVSTETDSRATSESVESSTELSSSRVSIPSSPGEPLHATSSPFPILPSRSAPVDSTASSFTCALNTAPESTITNSSRSNHPDVFVLDSSVANTRTLDNPDVVADRSHPHSSDNVSTTPANRLPDDTRVTSDNSLSGATQTCPIKTAADCGGPSSLPTVSSGVVVVLDAMCKSSLVVPMSPIHKSKSASALSVVPHGTNGDPSDRHGPCLIPSDRHEEAPPTTDEDSAHPSPTNKVALIPAIHRRSSDSDLSVTPKGNSLACSGSERLPVGNQLRPGPPIVRPAMNQESLDMLEYPFLTMTKYPPGFILHLGGTVSSRSVKLLERITNLDEPQSRDTWWTELRMEVRSHARALGCNVVLGYSEHTSICEDVCVLSASGTAAMINLQYGGLPATSAATSEGVNVHSALRVHTGLMTASLDRTDFERDGKEPLAAVGTKARPLPPDIAEVEALPCAVCHIPYSESSVPYQVTMTKCQICRRGKVPDVLFTTVELPDRLPTAGKGCVVQAYTVKAKRDGHGELNAIEISDGLPFLEYELHRLLVNKLKVKGMNAIFRLKVQVAIGEKLLVGHATGTAVLLTPLPLPPVPNVSAGKSWTDEAKLAEMQRLIQDEVKTNRELYGLNGHVADTEGEVAPSPLPPLQPPHSDTDDGSEGDEEEMPDLDLSAGNKDTCVLEVDDLEDVEVVGLLIDPPPPKGFHVVTTQTVPGLDDLEVVRNLQMFTQVWRAKILVSQNQQGQCQNPQTGTYSPHFQGMLQSVCFKLRRMAPCALCDLRFKVQLEADELQLSVYGMALGLGEPERPSKFRKRLLTPCRESLKKSEENDLMFNLEDDPVSEGAAANKNRPYSPLKTRSNANPHHISPSERYGVDLSPLSYVPGGKIERYLGNLNFFFIRESTSIKESGGLSGFVHSFVTEVLAIVRAHVTALGGNAMVSYFISECILYDNQHKNQGQCLLNVGGDVVFVSYRG